MTDVSKPPQTTRSFRLIRSAIIAHDADTAAGIIARHFDSAEPPDSGDVGRWAAFAGWLEALLIVRITKDGNLDMMDVIEERRRECLGLPAKTAGYVPAPGLELLGQPK